MTEKFTPTLTISKYKSSDLIKRIFETASPEKIVPEIPAQSLYLAARSGGLSSAVELLEIATLEQCSLMIDFDCWEKDRFNEERFWEWLELPDATDDNEILKKIFRATDLKIIALLMARYVDIFSTTERTEEPPSADYFTPDQGYTWIRVKIKEAHRNFLLNRFLACIYEYNIDIFYQILQVPTIATPSLLEEEAFQEKQRRLSAEGIPDLDYALEINSPKKFSESTNLIKEKNIKNVKAIKPYIYDTGSPTLLNELFQSASNADEVEGEFSLITNSAIIKWSVKVYDDEARETLIDQIKGALNIGLEICQENTNLSVMEIYKKYGLKQIYRFGLFEIFELQKKVKNISKEDLLDFYNNNKELFFVISGVLNDFPLKAENFNSTTLQIDYSPFFSIKALKDIQAKIKLL